MPCPTEQAAQNNLSKNYTRDHGISWHVTPKSKTRNSIETEPKRRINLILKPYVKDGRAGNLVAQLLLISLMVLLRMKVRQND